MTEITGMTDGEIQKMMLEENEILLCGIGIHARFEKVQGDRWICFGYLPPFGTTNVPEWMKDGNESIARLCLTTVLNMNDRSRLRLLALAVRDGGKSPDVVPAVHLYKRIIGGICFAMLKNLLCRKPKKEGIG